MQDYVKMDLQGTGWNVVYWAYLGGHRWRVSVGTVLNAIQ